MMWIQEELRFMIGKILRPDDLCSRFSLETRLGQLKVLCHHDFREISLYGAGLLRNIAQKIEGLFEHVI